MTSFPLELPGLVKHGLRDARTLLDLGSGEGSYLHCLTGAFPTLSATGLEANDKLIACCHERYPHLPILTGDVQRHRYPGSDDP